MEKKELVKASQLHTKSESLHDIRISKHSVTVNSKTPSHVNILERIFERRT